MTIQEQVQNEKVNFNGLTKDMVLIDLALERTILAKQRTTLSEISVFLSLIGVGLLVFKFFEYLFIKILGLTVSLTALFFITKLFHSYKKFKRKIKKIDKRNNYFR